MGRRYSRIVGKTVMVINTDGRKHKCTITGADFSIGLTIQDASSGHYFMCCNGPKSPVWRNNNKPFPTKQKHQYNAWLAHVYDATIAGKPIVLKDILKLGGVDQLLSAQNCAFSQ